MIVIVDTYCANLASIEFALERLGHQWLLSDDPDTIKAASHVILPGVAHAQHAMQCLAKMRLIDTLRELRQPVLGICMGMHLLYAASEEGDSNCLGIMPGKVKRLPESVTRPHMGWNTLTITRDLPLFKGIKTGAYVYFVHNYAIAQTPHTCALVNYPAPLTAVAAKDNFYATQFHPERSGVVGAQILGNFLELT